MLEKNERAIKNRQSRHTAIVGQKTTEQRQKKRGLHYTSMYSTSTHSHFYTCALTNYGKFPKIKHYQKFVKYIMIEYVECNSFIPLIIFRSSNPDVLRLLNRLDGKPDQPINLQNNDPYMYSYDIRKVLEYYEKR